MNNQELQAMREDEVRVANDKLKYPKILGRTYVPLSSIRLADEGFDSQRNDAMRLEANNPLN